MMVSVARFAKKAGVECEVSLENKMAVLNDEFAIDERKEAVRDKPEVETYS